jgi:hypothetical protein
MTREAKVELRAGKTGTGVKVESGSPLPYQRRAP